jgi:nitroreductase/NAD-dependent dihydropyrimidine dehydrogenase PreA subunit
MGYSLQEHGVPIIDEATCTACGQCVSICPDEVIVRENGKPKVADGLFLGCIACGHCMAVCPSGAIRVSGRGIRPEDRIELPSPDHRATADQLEALATARRSMRRFQPREVPREVLERIVRVATTAPMGIPPHEVGVVVFADRAKVQAFAEEACGSFERMGRFFHPIVLAMMRPFIGKYQYEAFRDFIRPLLLMLPRMRKQGRDVFTYDAAAAVLFHVGPMGDPADCAIVATYAMLAAESLGLGSCMLGTSVALTRDKRLKTKYGIPEENKVGVTLVLGYPAVEFRHGICRRLASVKYVE